MKQKQFLLLFIAFLFLYACNTDNSAPHNHHSNSIINNIADSLNYTHREKHFGVSLVNQPVRGSAFIDSTGQMKQFRLLKVQLVNDTVIPIHIQLNFSSQFHNLYNSPNKKFKAFLLTDSVNDFGRALNTFLNKELEKPSSFNTVIQPGEICTINFGMIFFNLSNTPGEIILSELFFEGQENNINISESRVISLDNTYTKGLDIILGVSLSSQSIYYSTIPCGQLSFPN